MCEQDTTGEDSTSNDSDAILAVSNVVPHTEQLSHSSPNNTRPTTPRANYLPFRQLAMDKSQVENIRVECLKRKYEEPGYSDKAVKVLAEVKHKTYIRGQQLFISWAIQRDINISKFTSADLVNFIADAHEAGYSKATLQTYRAAIVKLHTRPESIKTNPDIQALIRNFKYIPRPLNKSKVDITPTLRHLYAIPTSPAADFDQLRRKTAYLLAMSALLRPSDINRICRSQSKTTDEGLQLYIINPKEKRKKESITKPIIIPPNSNIPQLCPVQAYETLLQHPQYIVRNNYLFTKLGKPHNKVADNTIASWLSKLTALSTDIRPTPRVRSIASDLALERGVPHDDIITLGNWADARTFEKHYRRQRLLRSNVTEKVLDLSPVHFASAE